MHISECLVLVSPLLVFWHGPSPGSEYRNLSWLRVQGWAGLHLVGVALAVIVRLTTAEGVKAHVGTAGARDVAPQRT